MVVRWSRIFGVFALFALPVGCGGQSYSTADGDGGTGGSSGSSSSGGSGASGGSGSSGGSATGGTGTGGGTPPGAGGASPGSGGTVPGGGGSDPGSGGAGAIGATGGSGNVGGTIPTAGTGSDMPAFLPLPWDNAGHINGADNGVGIQGSWFFATDCVEATPEGLPCTVPDAALIGPDMAPGWSTSPDGVCAKGIATQVLTDPTSGMPAYALQWGLLLGFELNGTGAADGTGGPYDAAAYGIRGFMFDISGQPPPTIRISFLTEQTQVDGHFIEVTLPVMNQEALFADAAQGSWITAPVALDTSALTAVTFQVYTNTTASKPFDFCISNARVLL